MAIAWLPVKGYEGLYEVSSSGEVRGVDRYLHEMPHGGHYLRRGCLIKPIKPTHRRYPYLKVRLSRDGKKTTYNIHKLVAEAFLGPRPEGMEVRHGPAGSLDNHVGNLCYGTHIENMADTRRDGTSQVGERHWQAKLTENAVTDIRRRYALGTETYKSLGDEYGVGNTAIRAVIKGWTWGHVAA